MQIAVFVEPLPGNGFRARGAEPFALTAHGATRQEALARLKAEVQSRLRGGEIVTLDVGPGPHPFAKYAGMFPDDELTKSWEAAMADYRRKNDEAPEVS